VRVCGDESPMNKICRHTPLAGERLRTRCCHEFESIVSNVRLLTIACSWLSLALTKPSLYLSDAESSLNCLVKTAWSTTGHLVVVSLKAHTSIVTQPHLAISLDVQHRPPTQDRSAKF